MTREVPVIFDPGSRAARTESAGLRRRRGPGRGWKAPMVLGREVKSPTSTVWILSRTYSSGTPADYRASTGSCRISTSCTP